MKAVILIGGEGTRLRPLTCNIPKAMVPILNQPFLECLLHYLEKHGITDVILAMGHSPALIQSHLGDGTQLGMRLTYLVEESPLGTAGAVKNAEALLDEPFIVFNGDIITEINLTAMMRQHQTIKPKASLALTPVDNPTIYGVVETDTQGMVKNFVEKPSWDKVTSNMINAGIYILEPEVLKLIPPSAPSMFENYLFPRMLEIGEPILGYPSDAYWIDIGAPEKYLKVHHDLLLRWSDRAIRTEGESQIHPSSYFEGTVLIAENCVIAEDVKIKGPAVLGAHCEIAEGAIIEGAILWNSAQVGREATLRNCVIGSNCCIQDGCHIPEGCVLGDNVIVGRGSRLAPGTRIWPDSHI
ncbi:sugar phosphate nucleotidyltransferase [Chloroflexota bacterium]